MCLKGECIDEAQLVPCQLLTPRTNIHTHNFGGNIFIINRDRIVLLATHQVNLASKLANKRLEFVKGSSEKSFLVTIDLGTSIKSLNLHIKNARACYRFRLLMDVPKSTHLQMSETRKTPLKTERGFV